MNNATDTQAAKTTGDVVLQEVWRVKDALSAQYGHDLDKLFEGLRQREEVSGHLLVEPPQRRPKA